MLLHTMGVMVEIVIIHVVVAGGLQLCSSEATSIPQVFKSRVKTPEDVQSRYLQVLQTYKETRTLTRTWEVHGVDRDTIACTSVIAEVRLAANSEEKIRMPPFAGGCVEKYAKEMKEFFYSEPALRERIEEKKANREFLPISYKLKGAKGCASIASDF